MAKRKLNANELASQLFKRIQQGAGNFIGGVRNDPIGSIGKAASFAVQGRSSIPRFAASSPQVKQFVGDYGRAQVVKPITQGFSQLRQPGMGNKISGGLSVAQGAIGATPGGAAYNIGVGGVASTLQSLRTRQPIQNLPKAIYKGATNPTFIAEQGLGIGQKPINLGGVNVAPGLALGINFLTGNPKTSIKALQNVKSLKNITSIKGIKNMVNPNQAPKMAPRDIEDASEALYRLQNNKGLGYYTSGQIKKDQAFIRQIAADYFNKKFSQGKSFQDIAQEVSNRIRVDLNSRQRSLPDLGLGFVSKTDSAAAPKELKKILQQPVETPTKGLVPGSPQSPSRGGNPPTSGLDSDLPYFNTKNYNIPEKGKETITKTVGEVKNQIESAVGTTLSNKEAVNFANATSKVLHKVVDREQTLQWEGALLKARQKLAEASKSGKVDQEYIDNLLTIKTQGTDIARKLQSFSIGADPSETTFKDKILEAVLKQTQDIDKVLEAAKGVDFNDAQQASNFYRQFIKPTKREWVDLIRYNSMLSSPLTHIVNATSNAINSAVVAPVEKATTGVVDFLGSSITGKQQTRFAGESGAYLKGYYSKLGEASQRFANALRGKYESGNLDVRNIPFSTEGKSANIYKKLSFPTRMLEATDQFFTTLTKGGEEAGLNLRKSKGVNVGNIETESLNKAAYRLFRGELHSKEQGVLLNSVDDLTEKILSLRSSKNPVTRTISNFTLPFVKTPMNILKQGIEYSPAGFGTIPGATNKTEQLSKAILGTTGAAMAAMFVSSGRTTWAEPTDPAGRARFRAAGLQPYAVKIGDNWVSYQKLPPSLSFPIALMAALNDAKERKTIDQNQIDTILEAVAKFGNFYSDQSYLKNIGDAVAATKGSPEDAQRFLGNYLQQLVPYRAFLGWMARLTDPVQRKIDTDKGLLEKQVQNFLKEIPLASRFVPARLDEVGQPIPNQNQAINAFSPFRVTTERPDQKATYDLKKQESLFNRNISAAEKMMEQGKPVNFGDIAGAAETVSRKDLQGELQDKIFSKQVRLTGEIVEKNGKIYYPKGTAVKVIDMTRRLEDPQFSGKAELDKQELSRFSSEITKRKNEVADLIELGKLTEDQGEQILSSLKKKLDSVKSQVPSQSSKFKPLKLTGNPTIDKELISDQLSAYSSEINKIVDYVTEGKLTPEQGEDIINRIKAKQNELRGKSKSGGGSGRKRKVNYNSVRTTAKPIRIPTISVKIPKTKIPKYKPIKVKRVKYR